MKLAHCLLSLVALALLGACSGTTDYASTTENADNSGPQPIAEAVGPGFDDPGITFDDEVTTTFDDLPLRVYTETLPNTGLEVGFTTGLQRDWIDPTLIEAEWLHMQSCTGVSAASPLIVVVEGEAVPLNSGDDVIRYIDGRTVASSSRTLDGPVLQVVEDDFDGSLGAAGFNLRAIMGRYLWLGANLAERDYPFECTRG